MERRDSVAGWCGVAEAVGERAAGRLKGVASARWDRLVGGAENGAPAVEVGRAGEAHGGRLAERERRMTGGGRGTPTAAGLARQENGRGSGLVPAWGDCGPRGCVVQLAKREAKLAKRSTIVVMQIMSMLGEVPAVRLDRATE